jgi:tetratricopeptide (TPR) repeat protein
MDVKWEDEKLLELLEAYGDAEPIQEPQEARTDSQLKSLDLMIEEVLHKNPQGTVLDIGCGKGVVLAKLADIPSFRDNTKWYYLGADHSHLHDSVLQLAGSLRFHRRCEVIDIDTLYDSWIQTVDIPLPLLIIIRNVLHHLNIPETAQLLHCLNKQITPEDTLLLQDLLVFPKAERGNVCWDSNCIHQVFDLIGFDAIFVSEPSRSGNQWFSARIVKQAEARPLTTDDVRTIVADGRIAQLERWRSANSLTLDHPDSRIGKVAKIDFGLQIAALYQQLDDGGFLNSVQKKDRPVPDPSAALQLVLSSYDPNILDRNLELLPSIVNFRDRRNSQDSLEAFLSSKDSIVIVQGGISCGKTVMVSHVLSRRAHGRSIVPIDCEIAGDAWPILEQYLLAIGCRSSLRILSSEKVLTFASLGEVLETLVKSISRKSIVVFDHFEKLVDPNGQIMNAEVRQFLSILASSDGAKVIITTRRAPMLHFMPESVGINNEQPPVGRFPVDHHIENLLDDYVDRTSIGLEEYPASFLDAIDRFPYLAILAGKLINEAGIAAANDPMIQKIIKSYLYDELAKRIITPEARPALQLACILRIPAPRYLFEEVVGAAATNAAVETGLLFGVPDRYHEDLLTCASVLRNPDTEFDSVEDDTDVGTNLEDTHAEIAKAYTIISQESDGDPRWIREAHYHTLASGNTEFIAEFGSLYKGELFWAGRTWFRRFHKYGDALEALLAAEKMGLETYESRMLIAACLVRLGRREEGESCYRGLISDFPDKVGVKTSFIDSLINIGEFSDALVALDEFDLSMRESNPWVTGQYGRAYLGLQDYSMAAEAFRIQLRKYAEPPAIVFIRLAQAYFRSGERDEAQKTVADGLRLHSDDPALNTLYCANLLKSGSHADIKEAEEKLNALADEYPRNGYILQKLVTTSALLGDPSRAIARLERINWRVDPSRMETPVRIAVLLAQRQFNRALNIADSLPRKEEYAQAIMRKVFLTWAGSEQTVEGQRRVAVRGLEREVPESCLKNVPILTMYAQLARIAGDNARFDQILNRICELNKRAADDLSGTKDFFDRWDDFEPELP